MLLFLQKSFFISFQDDLLTHFNLNWSHFRIRRFLPNHSEILRSSTSMILQQNQNLFFVYWRDLIENKIWTDFHCSILILKWTVKWIIAPLASDFNFFRNIWFYNNVVVGFAFDPGSWTSSTFFTVEHSTWNQFYPHPPPPHYGHISLIKRINGTFRNMKKK